MKKSFDDYTRLAGSHGMKGSLWLGPDHLLVVEGRGFMLPFSEQYRRIDYSNIQAIIVVNRSAWIWWLVICGLGALAFAVASWSAWQEIVGLGISFALIAFVLGLFALMQIIKGPTCRCFMQTAVQVLRLRPLTRKRAASIAIRELEALCREHQSHIPVPSEAAMSFPGAPLKPASAPAAFPSSISSKRPWTGSSRVWTAGVSTFLWGLTLMAELYISEPWFLFLGLGFGIISCIATIIGLVDVARCIVPVALPVSLGVSLAIQFITGFAIYMAISMAGVIDDDFSIQSSYQNSYMMDSFNRVATFGPNGVVEYIAISVGAIMSGLGLVVLFNARARVKASDVSSTGTPPAMESPSTVPQVDSVSEAPNSVDPEVTESNR